MEGPASERLPLETLYIYQTTSFLYIVGASASESQWGVLKIARTAPGEELFCSEDAHRYTKPEISRLLRGLHGGNAAHGGLTLVCKVGLAAGLGRALEGQLVEPGVSASGALVSPPARSPSRQL